MAARGEETLRYGPMKPIGLIDPRTGRRPWAVVQLRREDRAGQMWNLVGFQTRLRIPEQARVFRMIPGLAAAEFLRWGSIHRNSYLDFPRRLSAHGALLDRPDLIFAGQLTGVEGYTESAASGSLAGINLDRVLAGLDPALPPPTTMLGSLLRYLRESGPGRFQPMNSNWGLVDPLPDPPTDKRRRRERLAERAQADFVGLGTCRGDRAPAGGGGSMSAERAGRAATNDPAVGHARRTGSSPVGERREPARFLRHLADERQLSPHTVAAYRRDLDDLARFLTEYVGSPEWTWGQVDRLTLRGFLGWCGRRGLGRRSAARKLSAVRAFFRFLHAEAELPADPTRGMRAPRAEKRLPGHLGRDDVESLFREADTAAAGNTLTGTRDLVILELLYGSGIRLAELHGLDLSDLDLVSDVMKVRGKGRKERVVPLTRAAVVAVRRYEPRRAEALRATPRHRTGGRSFSRRAAVASPAVPSRRWCTPGSRPPRWLRDSPRIRSGTASPPICWTLGRI